tara:strand:- start:234 stop:1139 length:906 start_codon:yes stop_codon:yes gene_type:complete
MGKEKYTVFNIEGGVGKHIAATAVVKAYKQQNEGRNIIIVCAWPEIFINNSNIYKVFKIGNTPNFYKDYIYKRDTKIFAHEPYKETAHILKQKHLIETWCNLVGVTTDNATTDITCNFREQEEALQLINNPSQKPVLIIQPFGGPAPSAGSQQYTYSWMRDIHPTIIQQVVNALYKEYHIVHICHDAHPQLQHVQRVDKPLPKKILISLLLFANKRLLIDSSLQHAAAALNLSSTVVWVATQPAVFGYDIHTNIVPTKQYPEGTVDSYLYDYSFNGLPHECMYSTAAEIHDAATILNTLVD